MLRFLADESCDYAIVRALRKTGGNKAEASRMLGISNKTLYNKLSDLGIHVSVDVR
jgi:DNA-binding NtrC family response regulator